MLKLLGLVTGFLIAYLFTALVCWEINPADWGWFGRVWALCWGIGWGTVFMLVGQMIDVHNRDERRLRKRPAAADMIIVQ